MSTIKVVVTNYGFNKPPLLSEEEYRSFKQIFQVEPTYSMAPKASFWDEFAFLKWFLIAIVGGLLFTLIYDPLAFIPAIATVLLVFTLINGGAQTMWNYQKFLNVKNRYYEELKSAIINSNNYYEFIQKASQI